VSEPTCNYLTFKHYRMLEINMNYNETVKSLDSSIEPAQKRGRIRSAETFKRTRDFLKTKEGWLMYRQFNQ